VLRLGFLEGRPGFVYCANLAYYEFLIRIKMREARAKQAGADQVVFPSGVRIEEING
jgi:hypothetical protein